MMTSIQGLGAMAARVVRKQQIEQSDIEAAAAKAPSANAAPQSMLLDLPQEVLAWILGFMDAFGLCAVSQVCKTFRVFDNSSTQLRLVESVAKTQALATAGDQAGRWRRRSWLARLYIEDCGVGFNSPAAACPPSPFKFMPPTVAGSFLNVKLQGKGPKLLVSDLSTADQPMLRWRLVVRGNTAVEFGVVPLSMEDDDEALHKCHAKENEFGPLLDAERPTGFRSSITQHSMLPFKTPILRGSVIELLARRGRLEVLVQHPPPNGQELLPYKGPLEVRFEQDFSPHHDVKLALTSWQNGAFDVLHPAPGSRLLGQDMQRAWDQACATAGQSAPQQQYTIQQPAAGENAVIVVEQLEPDVIVIE